MACTLTIIADPPAAADAVLRHARDAVTAAEVEARPVDMVHALGALAHCYLERCAPDVAEMLFEQALRWSRAAASNDLLVDLLCDLAELCTRETLHPGGARIATAADKARAHATEASALAPRLSDPVFEMRVLLRIGVLREQLGDEREAQALRERAGRLMASSPVEPGGPAIAALARPTLH